MRETFIIPDRFPGLNDYVRAARGNRYAAARLVRECAERVQFAAIDSDLKAVTAPVSIAIRYYEPNRRRDLDNVSIATKWILDALVDMGILADDNHESVRSIHHYLDLDRANPRVEVTIAAERTTE